MKYHHLNTIRAFVAASTALVGIALTSCETTDVDGSSSVPSPSGVRVVRVVFEGNFTTAEKQAVVKGANMSRGTKLYGVRFVEHKRYGRPSGSYVRVNWFSVYNQHRIPGHHGATVNGFYAGKGFNLISINDKFRGDLQELKWITHHEADHAFGRMHLPKATKRKLELNRGGNTIPPSQDWTKWPTKSSI